MAKKNNGAKKTGSGGFPKLSRVVALFTQRVWGHEGLEPVIYGFYAAGGGREVPVVITQHAAFPNERRVMDTLVRTLEAQPHGFMGILKLEGAAVSISRTLRERMLERIDLTLFRKASPKDVAFITPRYAEFYEGGGSARYAKFHGDGDSVSVVKTFRVEGQHRVMLDGKWQNGDYLSLSESVDNLVTWRLADEQEKGIAPGGGTARIAYDVNGYASPITAYIPWDDDDFGKPAPWMLREFAGRIRSHNCRQGDAPLRMLNSRRVYKPQTLKFAFMGQCSGCGSDLSLEDTDEAVERLYLPMASDRLEAIKISAERRELAAETSAEVMAQGLAHLETAGWKVERGGRQRVRAGSSA